MLNAGLLVNARGIGGQNDGKRLAIAGLHGVEFIASTGGAMTKSIVGQGDGGRGTACIFTLSIYKGRNVLVTNAPDVQHR